jgi:hypothetical protein
MPLLNLYLSELDESAAVGTASAWSGTASADLPTVYGTLYSQTPVNNWQAAFGLLSDVSVNVIDENVEFQTYAGGNLVGLADATTSTPSTTGLYTATTGAGYTNYQINDVTAGIGGLTDPACNLDFQTELSRAVFGSAQGIDLFNNEAAVSTAFGTAIDGMAATITAKFIAAGPTATLTLEPIQICDKIFQNMVSVAPERFTLMYNATVNGTPEDSSGALVVTSTSGSGATVDLFMNAANTVVEQMNVVATGSSYAKGETATFTYSAGNTITIVLNSVQAAMLNGTLHQSTELPIEVGDIFNAVVTVQNATGQTNVAGNTLASSGDDVARPYLLKMQMSAAV